MARREPRAQLQSFRSFWLAVLLALAGLGLGPLPAALAGEKGGHEKTDGHEKKGEHEKQAGHEEGEHHGEGGHHEHHRFLSLFGGARHAGGEDEVAVGGDFSWKFYHTLGVGAVADVTASDPTRTFASPALFVYPAEWLKVTIAPGVAFADGEQDFRFRTGFALTLLHAGRVSLAPSVSFDFNQDEVEDLYGLQLTLGF